MCIEEITGRWDYRELPENVVVGHDCFLERKSSFSRFRSLRTPGLILGDRVRVYTWTTFNVDPGGVVEVGDDTVLAGAVLMCAGHIHIGRRVIVSYGVTIADSDFHPRDPADRIKDAVANAPANLGTPRPVIISRPITIGDDVWIGLGAIILKGVDIGAGARIEPGAVVTRDVPPGGVMSGNPASLRTE